MQVSQARTEETLPRSSYPQHRHPQQEAEYHHRLAPQEVSLCGAQQVQRQQGEQHRLGGVVLQGGLEGVVAQQTTLRTVSTFCPSLLHNQMFSLARM